MAVTTTRASSKVNVRDQGDGSHGFEVMHPGMLLSQTTRSKSPLPHVMHCGSDSNQ